MTVALGIVASAHVQASVAPPLTVTGLHTWYDADDASTITISAGTSVSQWRDKSGNGHHLNQTGPQQPQRTVGGGSGLINGRQAISFDGVDDCMNTAAFTLPQPFTTIVVIDGGASSSVSWGLLGSVGGTFGGLYSGAGTITLYAGTNAVGPYGHYGKHVWFGFFGNGVGANTGFGVDGQPRVVNYFPGTAGTTTGWRVGAEKSQTAGYFFNAAMGEVLVYDHVLTDAEYAIVAGYLVAKWLPVTSTYAPTVLADSPALYWRLGETVGTVAADSSGNSRPGTYSTNGGPYTLGGTSLLPGDPNTSLSLAGGQVNRPVEAWMQASTLTVEALFNSGDVVNPHTVVSIDTTARGWVLWVSAGKMQLVDARGAGGPIVTGLQTLLANTTYHVVWVASPGSQKIYINGVLDNSSTATLAAPLGTLLQVGACWGGTSGPVYQLGGRIDEVAIYTTALSGARILAHAQAAGF